MFVYLLQSQAENSQQARRVGCCCVEYWLGDLDEIAKVKRSIASACDDQAEAIDPGPTAAVDACDAVAAWWDERVPVIESVSEQCLKR